MPPHRQWIFFFDCNIKASKVLTIFKMNIWNYPSFYFEEHVSSCCQKRIPLPYASSSWASEFPAEPSEGTQTKPPCTGAPQGPAGTGCACPASLPRINVPHSPGIFRRQRYNGATGWTQLSAPRSGCAAGAQATADNAVFHDYICSLPFSPLTSDLVPSDGEKL